jgi:predicted component of type VI protein secretion system
MRKNIRLFGFLVFTALIFSACITAEKEEVLDMEKIKVEIQAMEDAYSAGEKAKDADAVQIVLQKIPLKIIMYIRL